MGFRLLKYLITISIIINFANTPGCKYCDYVINYYISNQPLSWERIVRDKIGKSEGHLNIEDYKKIESLNLSIYKFNDLDGIEKFSELNNLYIFNKKLYGKDIDKIAKLTKLEFLFLESNGISDISSLRNNKNLSVLSLKNNMITDIASLADLEKLVLLYLKGNRIKDVSVLPKLKRIHELDLSNNFIVNIIPLGNIQMDKPFNTPNSINLKNNLIRDISPLLKTENLEVVYLEGNPLSRESIEEVIPKLREKGIEVIY